MPEQGFNPFYQDVARDTVEISGEDMRRNIAAHESRGNHKQAVSPRLGQSNMTPRERMRFERRREEKEEMARLERATVDMSRAPHALEKDPRFSDTIGAEAAYVDKLWFDSLVDENGQNRPLMERFEIYKEALARSKGTIIHGIYERGKVFPISGYAPGEIFDAEIARINRLLQ